MPTLPIGTSLAGSTGWPTSAELEEFLGVDLTTERADECLRAARALIEGLAGTFASISEELVLDGSYSALLFLPSVTVTAVASVEVNGVALDASAYSWSANGVLRRLDGHRWNTDSTGSYSDPSPLWSDLIAPRWVTVNYTHGLGVPEAIRAICLSLAARRHANPQGLEAETITNYSATFASGGENLSTDLTDDERAIVLSFSVPVMA